MKVFSNKIPSPSFNLLKSLSYGNGTIKEDHISSLFSSLLNPKNPHGLSDRLLINFLNATLENNSEIKTKLLSKNDEPKWSNLEFVLEESLALEKKSQDKRIIDIVLKFWIRKRNSTPDVVIAIENKLFDGSTQKKQLAEELHGLHKKYVVGSNNPPSIKLVFLAPLAQKGLESYELLKKEVEQLFIETGNQLPICYLPWRSPKQTCVLSILNDIYASNRTLPEEAKYSLSCLSELINIGFNVRNERVIVLRDAVYSAIKRIQPDFNLMPTATEGEGRYSFLNGNRRIVSVHGTSKDHGQIECFARNSEVFAKQLITQLADLGLSDSIQVNYENVSVKNAVWLSFCLIEFNRVVENADFLRLLDGMISESFARHQPLPSIKPKTKNLKKNADALLELDTVEYTSLSMVFGTNRAFSSMQIKWLNIFDCACQLLLGENAYYYKVQKNRITITPNGSKEKFVTLHTNVSRGRVELHAFSLEAKVKEIIQQITRLDLAPFLNIHVHDSIASYWIKPTDNSFEQAIDKPEFIDMINELVQQSYAYKFKL